VYAVPEAAQAGGGSPVDPLLLATAAGSEMSTKHNSAKADLLAISVNISPGVNSEYAILTLVFMAPRTSASEHSSISQYPDLDHALHAGGITGGHESIRERVSETANEALALLAELQPMGADPDLKGIEELKGWIRSEFMELVGELTFSDGPSVTRVEEIFSMLLDQMGTLQDLMEDEEGVTGFPAVADQMAALYRSWNNMQQLFDVQITIVMKQLALVVEAIESVRFAMDAAFIGPAERQSMILDFESAGLNTAPMPMEVLLSAIHTFASDEASREISGAGGFALRSRIAPVAAEWCDHVRATLHDENTASRGGAFTPQVIRALAGLAGRLDEVAWNC
jgi:hypothetical protein